MRLGAIFFILCNFSFSSRAQFAIQWIEQQEHSNGRLVKYTSDNRIIVCGIFGNDYPSDWVDIVINCFDTSGILLWQKYFSDTVNGGIEEPFDMVVDSFNNIYITGRMHLSFDGLPITSNSLLLKYNSSGDLLWFKQYGDSIGYKGAARRKQFGKGNIYIAGFMTPISGGTNHSYLAKYDTSGQLLWTKIDSNQYETIGRSVFVDNASYVYLVGTTACCTPGYKMFVSKFDSFGNNKWTTSIYDSAHLYAYTWESAIDDSANIYLTGETQDTSFSTAYDCAIAKVDSSGSQQWFYSYTTDSSYYWEESNSIICNSQHGVFVAGTIDASSTGYGFILNLSPGGSIMWDSIYNAFPVGTGFLDIFFDSASNVVALGGGYFNGINHEAKVININPTGVQNWEVGLQGLFTPSAGIFMNGSYYCTGYNPPGTGVASDDSLFIFQVSNDSQNSIAHISEKSIVNIFPNPASKIFNVSNQNPLLQSTLKIYSPFGNEIYSLENYRGNSVINCQSWSRGLYIIQLTANNMSSFYKIIIN